MFSQETETTEEFLPINIEGKEAFLSTKTGEYVFREHAETIASRLETTASGVVYTDIQMHTVAKKETISRIAKKYGLSKEELMKQNKLSSTKLSIGQELKIIKKLVVKSSSPVISQGESKIIARLHPGQTPTGLDAAPPNMPSTAPNPVAVTSQSNPKEDASIEKTNEEPTDIIEAELYTVKKGDTLYSIAKEAGLSIQKLKELNSLTLNNLSIGQKLKLK